MVKCQYKLSNCQDKKLRDYAKGLQIFLRDTPSDMVENSQGTKGHP